MLRIGIAAHNLHVAADAFRRVRFRCAQINSETGLPHASCQSQSCDVPLLRSTTVSLDGPDAFRATVDRNSMNLTIRKRRPTFGSGSQIMTKS
jgi:hypothetical protein